MGLFDWLKGRRQAEDAPVDPKETFAELALRVLSSHEQVARVTRAPEDFALDVYRHGTDKPMTTYLGNIYQEARQRPPEERAQMLAVFFGGMFEERPETWEEVAPRLLPVIRAETMFTYILTRPEAAEQVHRPALPFFCEALVIDSETSMAYLNRGLSGSWAVDDARLFERARENLAALEYAIEPYDAEASSPLFYVQADDGYESSRLLLPGFLSSFEGRVAGTPVAILPERSTLIVGGAGDSELLSRMLAIAARESEASPRRLSADLYARGSAGAIEPLGLPAEHPLRAELLHARRIEAGAEYNEQKKHIEAILDNEQQDIHVATVSLAELDGQEQTYCVWGEGVDSLLPEADQLILALGEPGDDRNLRVPFREAVQRLSSHLEPERRFGPLRYRTRGWPPAELLDELAEL